MRLRLFNRWLFGLTLRTVDFQLRALRKRCFQCNSHSIYRECYMHVAVKCLGTSFISQVMGETVIHSQHGTRILVLKAKKEVSQYTDSTY